MTQLYAPPFKRVPSWATMWELLRPFTLIMPTVGFLTGVFIASGATNTLLTVDLWLKAFCGAVLASLLNGASNALNQVFDLSADRINKPTRPIPSGRITAQQTLRFATVLYVIIALFAAAMGVMTFVPFAGAIALTVAYSVPYVRLKDHWVTANLAISTSRGLLLTLAGWSIVAPLTNVIPWFLGGVAMVYLFGAATTKDFTDIEGDRASNCITLPVQLGINRSAWLIAPFFVFPFLLLPMLPLLAPVTGVVVGLSLLTAVLGAWGVWIVYSILRDPGAMAHENHASWRHMYLMTMTFYVGLAFIFMV